MKKLAQVFMTLLERFIGKRFAANVAKLMSGTMVAMALNFVVTPVLTRLYTPAMFGVFGTITALVGTLSGVAALRFGMACVIPDDDDDSVNLLALAFLSIAMVFGVSSVVFIGFGDLVAAQYDDLPELGQWLWAVPVLTAVTAIFSACRYWCTRAQKFGTISGVLVTASVLSNGSKLVAGFQGFAVAGLVYGQMLGQVIATTWLFLVTFRNVGESRRQISRTRMLKMARKYKDFPKFNVPVTLINATAKNMPIFGLGWFFTGDVVGWYSMAYLVLNLPVIVVSDALRQVYYQKANETFQAGGDLFRETGRLTAILFGFGVIPAALFAIFAPTILTAFLGKEWGMAGEYARLLTPYLFTLLVVAPAATVMPVLNLQRAQLVWQVFSLAATAISLGVGGAMEMEVWAIGLFSLSGSTLNLILVAYVMWLLRHPERLKTGY